MSHQGEKTDTQGEGRREDTDGHVPTEAEPGASGTGATGASVQQGPHARCPAPRPPPASAVAPWAPGSRAGGSPIHRALGTSAGEEPGRVGTADCGLSSLAF